jgi:transcriptional regulator of nitric oxide reductase
MVGRITLLTACFVACFSTAQAELSEDKKALIQELFPSATVIEDKLTDFPVYPVYQLQELLGYAYESIDLSRLQGFASQPISMLVGMDTRGRFTGVKVLNHHEPVFLHGLGEEPLLERSYIGHWELSRDAIESKFDRPLMDYPQGFEGTDDSPFTELFFGYINAPMVGRNLLGDQGYQKLMAYIDPGAQVMLVLSGGAFPHVSESFIPGSNPERLSLTQNELAVEMRDLNLSGQGLELQAAGMPDLAAHTFFRMGGSAGFSPGADATLNFHIELARNHLGRDSIIMDVPVRFNANLFETVEPAPSFMDEREPI